MKIQLRRFLTLAISVTAVLTAIFAVAPTCRAQERKSISVSGNKNLPFSDGILAGNTLYVAGQEGTDDQGKLVAGGITPETKTALDNIQKVIKAAGFDLKDVVSVTVYLADVKEFGDMNNVYREFMPDPKPARATIQTPGLVKNARITACAPVVQQNKPTMP